MAEKLNHEPTADAPKPKICLISFGSYPFLSQANIPTAGGAERQQALLVQEMQRGSDVSVIVLDHGQESVEIRERIKIVKAMRPDFLNRKHGTLCSMLYSYLVAPYLLWRSLNGANADIYLQKMVGRSSALALLFCRLKRKKFIYSVSTDKECDSGGTRSKNFPMRILCKFTIKNAHHIIVQSKYQKRLLKANFNRDSTLIRSGHILPREKPDKVMPPIVLWVATIKKTKQPQLYLEVAREIRETSFQMVGGLPASEEDPQYFEEIERLASRVPNLQFFGFVPYNQVDHYFARGSIFVNTSAPNIEGFPNTFLQAWGRYTPVVSLNCDPDEVICENKLGFHSRTFEQMVKDVKLLLQDEKLRAKRGANGRKYVEQEHDIKKIVGEYAGLFDQLSGGKHGIEKNRTAERTTKPV